MDKLRYGISGGLTPEQLRRMHEAALRIIERVGVRVSNPHLLETISGLQGVAVDGERVCLGADAVNAVVYEHVRRQENDPQPPPGGFTIRILSGYAFLNLDWQSGELRPMLTEDCIEAARLVGCMHEEGVRGGTPGLPQDVPPALREILAFKIGCEHSRTAGAVGMTSMKSAEYIRRMSQAAGVSMGGLSAFVMSPLRVEGDALDMAVEFLKRGWEGDICVEAMPLQGVTTPIHLPAAFVENIATVLAAFAILRLAWPDRDVGLHFDVYPFDLKLGTMAYGTPEHILSYLMATQINRHYGGGEFSCKAFHTSALFPDAHSIAQRASFGAIAALNGARDFQFGGMLGIDKIFSAEQLVIDVEIVRHLAAATDEVEFTDETLGAELIEEVGPAGEYITHPSTLAKCREIWSSELFANTSPERWQATDKRRLRQKVSDRIGQLLAGYDFGLDRDIKRELDMIYAAAMKELA